MRLPARLVLLFACSLVPDARAQSTPERPFGTLREQAAMQQEWLRKRLDTFLPGLMRKHGIDLWVVPMREYNEDPVFPAITSPQTFSARRRTIYVFFDKCAGSALPPSAACVERIALGGTSQGDPVIERGDVLHSDLGITVARLNTDTQHMAYVLLPGETDAPEGLRSALASSNALQDIVMGELRPGRTGNEILAASRARMKEKGIDGTIYSHPIGQNGHGAGPLIGLWDYQDGVAGRGDAPVIASMWWSIELSATTPVAEWGGQPVRMAQEEDAVIGADGRARWALRRQDKLFLVR